MMRGLDDNKLYGWIETGNQWKMLDKSTVWYMGVGEGGRLLKIDYDSEKVFEQTQTP